MLHPKGGNAAVVVLEHEGRNGYILPTTPHDAPITALFDVGCFALRRLLLFRGLGVLGFVLEDPLDLAC